VPNRPRLLRVDATASGRWPRFTATVSERQVAALSEVSRTLVSDADYQQVLAALIEKVGRILDVESGGFMLFDEPSGELQLQLPAFGFNSDDLIRAYRVPLSAGGNAVTVFLTGQPYFTNDAAQDGRVLQRFVQLYHAQRILSVPLQVEGRSIGVFHAINKRSGDFGVEDVELLQLIAPQLAVIIKSANMLRTLRDQEAQLERLIHIHNNLTEMAIGGHDLVDLVDRLAELIQAEVVVAESGGQLVAAPKRSRAASPELVSLIDDLMGGHGDFSPRQISYPSPGWVFMVSISSQSKGPGLFRMASGMPILPTSCSRPPWRRASTSRSLRLAALPSISQ